MCDVGGLICPSIVVQVKDFIEEVVGDKVGHHPCRDKTFFFCAMRCPVLRRWSFSQAFAICNSIGSCAGMQVCASQCAC